MKTRFLTHCMIGLTVLGTALSCQKQSAPEAAPGKIYSFTVHSEPAGKPTLDGTAVNWKSGDALSIISRNNLGTTNDNFNKANCFINVISTDDSGPTATFTGEIGENQTKKVYAVHPYSRISSTSSFAFSSL